ncbi:hypothetical protein LLEC1_03571 [Akanthomyces lecanii]|uniref:ABC transporter domain-containing protein n=1 Tax=Cordyceps confragosa TaxID=2714763 RepID=A0A179I5Y8_CORDF|nr:hypothetical protein LLEC1_03571 [Akanthomyces lecanii]
MSSVANLDALFGPQLAGHFDFTILFEHAMLWLVPTGVLILVTPMYLKRLARAERQVRPGILLWVKVACGLALVGVQATNIALWHDTEYFRSKATVSACAMSLVASICILAVLAITHSYCLQPSSFLSVFLSVTMIFDIAMARSYFLRNTLGAIATLQVCVVVLKFLLIIFEEVPKRSLYHSRYLQSTVSAETASGFWNRSFFIWLNPLLIFGWFKSFTSENLPSIGDEFASDKLFDHFQPYWANVSKSSKYSLIIALLSGLKWQFSQVLVPRLSFVGFTIGQPFLLQRTVEAVSRGNIDINMASGLIGACALIYIGIAMSRTLFEHWEYRVVTCIRGILIVAIYDKMLRLKVDDLESSAAVTLMSTDVDGIEQLISLAYESWTCVIQLALGIWLLYRFVGPACFLIVIPTLVTFLGSLITAKVIANIRAAGNAETQKRVAATSNILAQMKSIKSMGLSGAMKAFVADKREVELKVAMRERYSVLWVFAFGAINYTITPALVFAGAYFWTRADNKMTISEVFTILAILSISTNPLISLFRSITKWAAGAASIGRIYDYLMLEELHDPRDAPCRADPIANDKEKSSSPERKLFAVEFNGVSVTAPLTGPILRDISIQIPWGNLTMMWGPIGCGKTTFLNLILGEQELNTGTVSVGSKNIACCSQETWIPNTTIQEAVVGQLPLDLTRYRAVIRACALDVDIADLPDGDMTKTGSGGCNLSGGQRQRLSLARAAYTEEEIIVVDDGFSSVDPDTAGAVFQRLFGPNGMVRDWNCTVVMTTNRLELLDYAHQIYQFTKDGRIIQQDPNESDESADGHESSDDGNPATNPAQSGAEAGGSEDSDMPQVQAKDEEILGDTNGKAGDFSLYSYFLGSAGYMVLLGWLLFAMIAAVGEWSPVIYLRVWYSESANNPYPFIGYGAFSILCIILNVSSGAATPQYLNETDSGALLNRFGQDISLITRKLSLLVNQFVFLSFTVLVEMAIIAAGSAYVVPVMALLVALLAVIQVFYLRSSRQLRQIELESSAALFTLFVEASDGVQHIRSFGWQDHFRRKLYAKLDRSQKPTYLLYCIQRWLTLSLDVTSAVTSIVLVSVTTLLPSKTTSAAVGLAMLGLMDFSATANLFIQGWTSVETGLGAVRRIKMFAMNTPQEKDALSGPPVPDNWPNTGKLDFNSLTATYKTTDGTEHKAVDSLTVTIAGGQKVGLMGRTGSGKSTVLSAVLRMVDCTGSVSIDGRDTRTVPRELLRSRITTITQDGLRLKAALRFNMYPFDGGRPSDDEIIEALRSVSIWAHVAARGGLDANYSAMRFSTSQKQLFFIARGILHQAKTGNKIVMIDEVTSSMATDAEPELQRLIDASFNGCTILVVSHRPESFQTADGVLRLKSGQLDTVLRRRSNGDLVEVVAQ